MSAVLTNLPDAHGRFGPYGGQFVPETLMAALDQLSAAYAEAWADRAFQDRFRTLLRERMIKLTYPWNVTGAPAIALPCGRAEDGLPASVQLIGPPAADGLVLGAAALLERALAG